MFAFYLRERQVVMADLEISKGRRLSSRRPPHLKSKKAKRASSVIKAHAKAIDEEHFERQDQVNEDDT
ncbi:hypothetical protein TNCV_4770831 [Trichonephila clavipes]|nr:hypothetical protein TNCV_4770831 [Trichonephila clavipes]